MELQYQLFLKTIILPDKPYIKLKEISLIILFSE
ncbi:hypothetical protein IGI86_002647 [Enterococcus sp. AZ188]